METMENFAFNFHVGEEPKRKEKIIVRGKTVRERCKKRKHLKLLKKKDEEKNEKAVRISTDQTEKKVNKEVSPDKSSGKRTGGGITSSLFTKNPDLPDIEKADVIQVTEDVFSNQEFSSIPNIHSHMVKNLESRLGLTTMTAIQFRTIPTIMQHEKDVLIQSQTGSGKTLAYAVPIVNSLQAERPKLCRSDGTFAVIVVPTRELAIQTYECLVKLVYPFTWLVPGCLMGGEKRKAEKARIRKGINILVATPGRLEDHLDKTESLQLQRLKWIVIDEADRLLDLGYERSLQEILTKLKGKSQFEHHTLLLSATLTKGVERLAGMSLMDPLHLSANETNPSDCSGENENFAIPESLSQKYTIVPMKLRLVTLSAFIMDKFMSSQKAGKIIVFLSTHVSVDFHFDIFKSVVCSSNSDVTPDFDTFGLLDNIQVYKLHGEMPQAERTETFHKFVLAKSGVLFCTDVAARGLHLPKVKWIIQYTAPPSSSEYIHRIGRTARAGTKGQSLLFLLPSESDYIGHLNQQQISLDLIDMHSILQRLIINESIHKSSKKPLHNQTITQNATLLQNAFEKHVLSSNSVTELAGRACLSFIRGYSTYPKNMKNIFNVKELHLGHVAKSFALRQAPKGLGQKYGGQVEKPTHRHDGKPRKRKLDASKISEFDSGGILKKKKKIVSLETSD